MENGLQSLGINLASSSSTLPLVPFVCNKCACSGLSRRMTWYTCSFQKDSGCCSRGTWLKTGHFSRYSGWPWPWRPFSPPPSAAPTGGQFLCVFADLLLLLWRIFSFHKLCTQLFGCQYHWNIARCCFFSVFAHFSTFSFNLRLNPASRHSLSLCVPRLYHYTRCLQSACPPSFFHIMVWSESVLACDWPHGLPIKIKSRGWRFGSPRQDSAPLDGIRLSPTGFGSPRRDSGLHFLLRIGSYSRLVLERHITNVLYICIRSCSRCERKCPISTAMEKCINIEPKGATMKKGIRVSHNEMTY